MNVASPGYKTSEFYIALFARLGGFLLTYLVLSGKVSPTDASGFSNVMLVILGMLGPTVSDQAYIQSRTIVKKSLLDNASQTSNNNSNPQV